jgi:hypothetical protein
MLAGFQQALGLPGWEATGGGGRPAIWALVKADSILLSSWASAAPLMVYGRRSALSGALYAGAQVLFCSVMMLGA